MLWIFVVYCLVIENAYRAYVIELREAAFYYLFGGFHSLLFWVGLIFFGCVVPMFILFNPRTGKSIPWVVFASSLVIFGILCERYVIVLPGLTHGPELFPGMVITPPVLHLDGNVTYSISMIEFLQALGVFGVIAFLFLAGLKYLALLPTEARRLEDTSTTAAD